jgi:UMF1 family MFS transporter
MATIYGAEELKLKSIHLMGTLLMIQFVAFFGSMLFNKIAEHVGTRRAIVIGLVVWMCVVAYAHFLQTATQFYILGAIVGMTLGGTQALSRSYYGSMVPESSSAEFFGFYTVFTKFSSIWGPWTYAAVTHTLGARTAISSLIIFFIVGLGLLLVVNEAEARRCRTEAAF